ncbi:MAG: FAD-dependent monooxygenase [Alphaproteobacteria bacterium]
MSGTMSRRGTASATGLSADVLVIGAGVTGGALACALAQAGVRVIAVDRDPPSVGVSFLSPVSRRLLEAVGVWDEVEAEAGAIRDLRVADGGSPLFLHVGQADTGGDPLAWSVESRVVRRALRRRMAALDTATLIAPAGVTSLRTEGDGAVVVLEDGRQVRGRLLVAADGRDSPTRAAAGIGVTRRASRRTAIVTTVAHGSPHEGVACEHFLAGGPLAVLPLAGDRSAILWTEDEERAATLVGLRDDAFLTELARHLDGRLGRLRSLGPRRADPLVVQVADRHVGRRLALVGDAAHAVPPVAGQGVTLGLRDAAILAELVVETSRLGLDVGDSPLLARYQRRRRGDTVATALLIDGVMRLFTSDRALPRLGRDIGLAVVNALPPLKQLCLRRVLEGPADLPRLMRGEAL